MSKICTKEPSVEAKTQKEQRIALYYIYRKCYTDKRGVKHCKAKGVYKIPVYDNNN